MDFSETKAVVREEVWQHGQEQSGRNRETSWCVLGTAKERHNAGFHSWSSPVRAGSTPFCQNLSRAYLLYQFYFSLEIQPQKRIELWS